MGRGVVNRHRGLERRTELRRTPTKARRTGRLPAKSDKRRLDLARRQAVILAVLERDGCTCRAKDLGFGPCWGPLTPHHLKKASQGGPFVPSNLVTLCSSHNTRVEDEPTRARQLGLVVYAWEATADGSH